MKVDHLFLTSQVQQTYKYFCLQVFQTMLISVHEKGRKMAKMLRLEFLTPDKTPHLPVLPLYVTPSKIQLPPVDLNKSFSTIGHQTTAHKLSCDSR